MRILLACIIIVVAALLFMLPLTETTYDFLTDDREDNFDVTTGATTNTTVTLIKPVYDDDTSTISILSDDSTDTPTFSSYNTTSRAMVVTGLSENTTRTLTATYDVAAFEATSAISTIINRVPFIWLLVIIAFPAAALFGLFTGRAD